MSEVVVLIDDDADDLQLMQEAIEDYDSTIKCVQFVDPEVALNVLLGQSIIIPNYVFIDINMPKITGDICLKSLRQAENFIDVKIAMISTSMSQNVIQASIQGGANFAVAKPNSMGDYRHILDTIFSK